jgi:hypothetical protein
MNDDTQKPPTDEQTSKSLSCPKCSKTDIRRPYGWGAFGISIVVLFVGAAIVQAVIPEKAIEAGQVSFAAQELSGGIQTCLVVAVIWTFFSALLGKNRCKACGHRWKDRARA